MKIRCDVCDKVEATVFCCADEAALCDGCDHRVHHANMLASKHSRFSLVHPSFKESPLCDICQVAAARFFSYFSLKCFTVKFFMVFAVVFLQVRRAVLFCQEDRAILCRECDLPIHKVSEHTQKHNRFLLTGVKLSGHSQNTASSSTGNCDANIGTTSNRNHQPYLKKPSSASNEISSSSSVETASPPATFSYVDNHVSGDCSISTSSISEYLETVPGWNVDDFLDPSFSGNNSFGKGWNAPYF